MQSSNRTKMTYTFACRTQFHEFDLDYRDLGFANEDGQQAPYVKLSGIYTDFRKQEQS